MNTEESYLDVRFQTAEFLGEDNISLFFQQIRELGQIGASGDETDVLPQDDILDSRLPSGRTRLALDNAEKIARDTLCRWMREAGLLVHVDPVGNIFGMYAGNSADNTVSGQPVEGTCLHAAGTGVAAGEFSEAAVSGQPVEGACLHVDGTGGTAGEFSEAAVSGQPEGSVQSVSVEFFGGRKPLVLGSHIDTVAQAGSLDGVYGVLSALCVARAFVRSKEAQPLVVAAFTNEEGVRYQPDMLGSLHFANGISTEAVMGVKGIDGTFFGEELNRIGYAGSAVPFVPGGYFELHVEQGPVLDAEGISAAAVTGVQGISWQKITLSGQPNHAGTTPTALRRDPMRAFGRLLSFIREYTDCHAALMTIGRVEIFPNLVNVIPAELAFTVDIRDPDPEAFALAEKEFMENLTRACEAEQVTCHTERLALFQPVPFTPSMIQIVEDSLLTFHVPYKKMVSGAGHDAQMMARICPTAMIFVPSIQGLSHCPQEYTRPEDLLLGLLLLASSARRAAKEV